MAEGLLNHYGKGNVTAYSAGSFPAGYVHPVSLQTLAGKQIATDGYHSKSWNEFLNTPIDIVITVCDAAAGESCPIFPGKPVKAHWGVPDPAKFVGSEAEIKAEFNRICTILEQRVHKLLALPIDTLERDQLQQALSAIGKD